LGQVVDDSAVRVAGRCEDIHDLDLNRHRAHWLRRLVTRGLCAYPIERKSHHRKQEHKIPKFESHWAKPFDGQGKRECWLGYATRSDSTLPVENLLKQGLVVRFDRKSL